MCLNCSEGSEHFLTPMFATARFVLWVVMIFGVLPIRTISCQLLFMPCAFSLHLTVFTTQ